MKILIDIDELEQSGTVTPDVSATLRAYAIRDTGSTAINMVLAFGAMAIAAGLLALEPSAGLAAFFGFGFILLGWLVKKQHSIQWGKLGSIWMIVGALILSGASGLLIQKPIISPLIAAIILATVSFIAHSRLLIILTPLALVAALGENTRYWHSFKPEPTFTILLFSVLAFGAWQISKQQKAVFQNLSITFSRMCVVLVNLGFWFGSLCGDFPAKFWWGNAPDQKFPKIVFVITWAIALLFAGAWGAKNGRRFMVNTVAVFGAIHFYTQWFEYMGLHAVSVIAAGLVTIAFGLGLWHYNRKMLIAN